MHKIGSAHLQCVKIDYAKMEYKGVKTLGAKDYTSQTSSLHFGQKNVQVQHPQK